MCGYKFNEIYCYIEIPKESHRIKKKKNLKTVAIDRTIFLISNNNIQHF